MELVDFCLTSYDFDLQVTFMKSVKKVQSDREISFDAIIETPTNGVDGAYITIPFDVKKEYGTGGQIKVKATFDGHPYRGIIVNMGSGGHVLGIRKDIREIIKKKKGNTVTVTLIKDTEKREVAVPNDLVLSLSKKKKDLEFFNSLSYTNRKEYVQWITSAKKPETRDKRLLETLNKLSQGLRNPSEKPRLS